MYKVEKGIPYKAKEGKTNGQTKYPFGLLDVGDSFLVRQEEAKKAYSAARAYKSRTAKTGWGFDRQAEGEGVRFFRVS